MSNVNAFPQTLADVVTLAMKRHGVTTGRALAEKSKTLDLAITYTVLNQILAGEYRRRMSPATRERLAKLSGVRRSVVDQLAGAPLNAPFAIPEDLGTALTGDQREAVLAVMRAFAAANERADTATDQIADRAAYAPDHPMQDEIDGDTDS